MAARNHSERDFDLKTGIRALLWAQGYSTRLDVLLAYALDPKGRSSGGKAGLTDLDVLGVRLDPGFRVHQAIADCKTTSGQVAERLFWLAGVARFFESDTALLVRSQPVPEHAPILARTLDIALVGPNDLTILTNTYLTHAPEYAGDDWDAFFKSELLAETLTRVSRLPTVLEQVERYREAQFWMDAPHLRLQRVPAVLQLMAREGSRGPTFQLVFADIVWLYVFALWDACQVVTAAGPSRLEQTLRTYLAGDEAGVQALQRAQRAFEQLAKRASVDVVLPIQPPYFDQLLELIARLLRRPVAAARMARRAEWLVVGQTIGRLGSPPWPQAAEDAIAEKLLSDVAAFLVRASGLDPSFLNSYRSLLNQLGPEPWPTVLRKPDSGQGAPTLDPTQEQAPDEVPGSDLAPSNERVETDQLVPPAMDRDDPTLESTSTTEHQLPAF